MEYTNQDVRRQDRLLDEARAFFFNLQKQTDNPVFRHDNLKYHSFTLFHVV